MADDKIMVLARFKANKGMEDQLREVLMTCAIQTRAEAGCINYDLYQLENDKTGLILHENWRSKKDHDLHMKMPYVVEMVAKIGGLCSAPAEITRWEMLK